MVGPTAAERIHDDDRRPSEGAVVEEEEKPADQQMPASDHPWLLSDAVWHRRCPLGGGCVASSYLSTAIGGTLPHDGGDEGEVHTHHDVHMMFTATMKMTDCERMRSMFGKEGVE